MMNISTRDRLYFPIHLLNHNSLSHQTWLIDRYKQGNIFLESFEQFGGQELRSRSFSIYQSAPITQ